MNYETYFSIFQGNAEEAELDETRVNFPYGNFFAQRIRICWRAQFIAEFASLYWILVAVRNNCKDAEKFNRTAGMLYTIDAKHDYPNGDLVSGQVAFPAVDGLRLDLFLRPKATTS